MAVFYVPYQGERPVALTINGHRLVILSRSKSRLNRSLEMLGGDRVQKVVGGTTQAEQLEIFTELGRSANSGIVVAPRDVSIPEVIKNLETQLPWLH